MKAKSELQFVQSACLVTIFSANAACILGDAHFAVTTDIIKELVVPSAVFLVTFLVHRK